jgi:hypothetical protein
LNPSIRGSSWNSTAAIVRAGTARKRAPGSPKRRMSGVVRAGPRAKPALPPTEKKLIPRARADPET